MSAVAESSTTLLQHVKRVEVFEVEQTYLATTTVAERCRIRRRQQGTNQSFQHQAWVAGADGSETLMERTLSGREYFSLMKQADPNTRAVRKTLTCFTWAHSYWELNVFQGEVEGNCILEVEAESADSRLTLPPMCEAIREVTNEPGFDSYLIAQQLARGAKSGAGGMEARAPVLQIHLDRTTASKLATAHEAWLRPVEQLVKAPQKGFVPGAALASINTHWQHDAGTPRGQTWYVFW